MTSVAGHRVTALSRDRSRLSLSLEMRGLIVPLVGRPGHVAVQAVCQESVFWETLERLKGAGASAILVMPIEKMML